jgi:hypothetical protein
MQYLSKSFPYIVNSGVLWCSNFSSLFFVLEVNDVCATVIHSRCLLYTKDIKLYEESNSEDDVKLQEDINMVYN